MQSEKKNHSQCTGKKYPKKQQTNKSEQRLRETYMYMKNSSYVLEFIITYSPVWMVFQSYNANTALMFDDHVKCDNLC